MAATTTGTGGAGSTGTAAMVGLTADQLVEMSLEDIIKVQVGAWVKGGREGVIDGGLGVGVRGKGKAGRLLRDWAVVVCGGGRSVP